MAAQPNAVELTVEQAWFIAETIGAGTFPWVLAITMPYTDAGERGAFMARQAAELTRMGLMSEGGAVNSADAEWIRQVCFPDRWLELRNGKHTCRIHSATAELTAPPSDIRPNRVS